MSDDVPLYVYVLEQGCYSDRGIIGVYESPAVAMAEYPKDRWTMPAGSEPGTLWDNLKDWDESRTITRYQVTTRL